MKYIIDSNIFDHLILLDNSKLAELWTIWKFYVVSNVKNYQLKGLIDKNPWNEQKIENVFSILGITTLPNRTFPWMEDSLWSSDMHPFDNNNNQIFHAVRWNTTNEGSLHDALIADATSIVGWILITEDTKLTKRCQENSVPVLDWQAFLQSGGFC